MMKLFACGKSAYGLYRIDKNQRRADGKVEGKAHTLREPVSLELWEQHLSGTQGFGIIPIREDDLCSWGVIDVDDYAIKLIPLAKQIKDLPLVLCRTKSGGAHLFLFTTDPVPASLMQLKLREVASNLGFGGSEIFPKQTHILVERGDFGNWLNMPYFNEKETDRYGIGPNGKPLSLTAFLKASQGKALSQEQLEGWTLEAQVGDAFSDGPPCLQVLAGRKIKKGNRNNALLNVGIYCKLKYPERWEEELEPEGWKNPIRKVKPPRLSDFRLEPVDMDDVKAIVDMCDSSFYGKRDKAILLSLLDTGARAIEFLSINLNDYNYITGEILIREGKGGKYRSVFLGKKSRRTTRAYLRLRQDDNSAMWVLRSGERLTYSGLRQIVRRRAIRAGIITPSLHSFRRAFALNMLRAGIDIYSLQKLMGHADLQVLQRYLAQTTEDIKQAHQLGSPVDKARL